MKRTGEVADCISDPPVIPDLFEHVWGWFLDLNAQRNDIDSISWSDIHAYFLLKNQSPNDWDLELISKLDRQYLEIMSSDAQEINSATF